MTLQRYGLFGWPVKHSVSPQMQGAAFAALGIEATYELLPVPPEELAAKVRELVRAGYRGWNVTVPHKGAMRQLVDHAEPAAEHADSVNTVVVRDDGSLDGFSTDGYGLAVATREAFGIDVRGSRFLFWGTGGAARATSIYFALEGAAAITLVNRTLEKAESLAAKLRQIAPACTVDVVATTVGDRLRQAMAEAQVVYQCTSVGLRPDDPFAMPPEVLLSGMRVMDMIYHPTRLLEVARQRGCETADGRGMLLHQCARSFSIWTGQPSPVEVMRAALDRALH